MRVKLCARCPYTPRDLADHYDPEAALRLCATCDVEYELRKTQRGQTCLSTTINTTGITGTTGLHAAPSATENSASFVIILAAPPSAQGSASSISRSAGRATAIGYGDFARPEDRSKTHTGISRQSKFPNKEPAC
jgi:hypothetical protein